MKTELLTYGFEIEGEWGDEMYNDVVAKHGGRMVSDGSIRHCDRGHSDQNLDAHEYNSSVFEYRNAEHTERARALFEYLQKMAEKKRFHWNDSCGFHVHTGFSPKRPPEIMSKEFTTYFLGKLKAEYPTEWKKRHGNSYCQTFEYDEVEIYRPSDRYRAINYCALSKHGTIEFRFFPMNDPMVLYEYIRFVLRTITEFMDMKLERRIEVDITSILKPKVAIMRVKVPIAGLSAVINKEAELNQFIEIRRKERADRLYKKNAKPRRRHE